MQDKIAVIGAGSWGTALASLLGSSGYAVTLYAFEDEVIKGVNENNENPLFLQGIKLSANVCAKNFSDIPAMEEKHIVWAVPTQFSRRVAEANRAALSGRDIIIATKGIEIATGKLVIEMLSESADAEYSIISGPSFAKEVALSKPTAVSVASKSAGRAEWWQNALSAPAFRCYCTDDVTGVEIGGAIKNVIAVAAGISDGLGFGYNARAGLITRGLAEITRLGVAMGAKAETFMGLSGMGDLVLTCTGDLSRNRQVGLKLAEGFGIDEITGKMNMVAEGVYTAKAAYAYAAKAGIEMPITEQVYKVIYENKNPKDSVMALMERPLRKE
ncbi:NAD(P)H-dependent glycerol-3-phosphate dehydrogenase [Geovibrio ferrireducens]|jgi:glycerol-3-phosphate dehydrogenase (NAD(P)+)|uniref:NAD(P)H-dependent glycerol-3-phosphate dehydrogenase n=1 Tax=Geovibrio ferrireducens TaxID=46201 RepID=UPI0022468871|nr:NAD(P)H-dependent glycerol-3-phosphate dehydrogenase [Geovibrio ferrireducens]